MKKLLMLVHQHHIYVSYASLHGLSATAFTYSSDYDKFTITGCNSCAYIITGNDSDKDAFRTGCVSTCKTLDTVIDGTCSGIGCCQVSIPRGIKFMRANFSSFLNRTVVADFNPCSTAFLVNQERFCFLYFFSLTKQYDGLSRKWPIMLDWAIIEGDTCETARRNSTTYACRSTNSKCFQSRNGLGYLCNCSSGYQGNPYLEDIDECKNPKDYPCKGTCTNMPGTYDCSCPAGTSATDPRNEECVKDVVHQNPPLWSKLAIGSGSCLLPLLFLGSWTYWGLQKRKLLHLKQKFFQHNGGMLLQQQISSHQANAFRIFTLAEMESATNHFDEKDILGRGGYGIVYRGILDDKRIVAIKKSVMMDVNKSKEFAKEMLILSQINHRNVVKLLGCCLEVEVPMLVYEYIPNGTLFQYIHEKRHECLISLHTRLRIALEAAEALAYLHSAASPPILHGDVKSSNILLDQNVTAKVSDFGTSILAPNDKKRITTIVQGTLGYLDPQYLQTCQLTDKSDVYSYGVVLVELLSGKKALSFGGSEEDISLAMNFISCANENRLLDILDPQVVNEALLEQLKNVIDLAVQCLSLRGEERPAMREIVIELEAFLRSKKRPWVEHNPEEMDTILGGGLTFGNFDTTRGGRGCPSLNHKDVTEETGR